MRVTITPGAIDWQGYAARFDEDRVLSRLRALTRRARHHGVSALRPDEDTLIPLGMEITNDTVTKNSYGMFGLAWQAVEHPEWAAQIASEVETIRRTIKDVHGVPVRFLIWAGMGGSVEDKSMYAAMGLLRRVEFYALDSTDPAKLHAILADITRRARQPLAKALRSTLVVGMALGMTSFEPVVNLEKLTRLYAHHGVTSEANFLYLTLPGSLLDEFARPRAYRRVPLQLDGQHTTSGRHSAPLTRGALLPLALGGTDMTAWMTATSLTEEDIASAWRVAAFLHAEGLAGRDKVTLLPSRAWRGVSLWTKQNVEESLGKSETLGIKIVIDEALRMAYYRATDHPAQDRVFLVLRTRGDRAAPGEVDLQRRGYPLAVVEWPRRTSVAHYMQWMHYVVFGLGYLRAMNVVTQPNVELYKAIAGDVHREAASSGGVHATRAWRALEQSPRQARWKRRVTVYASDGPSRKGTDAASLYANVLREHLEGREAEYGELTFFGDTRYAASGRSFRRIMDRAADRIFRRTFHVPVDVYEGPAMNHSYHEMIIGHGRCVSTIIMARRQLALPEIDYTADYHIAQFLATRMALLQRGRPVVAILVDDAGVSSRAALADFFRAVEQRLRHRRGSTSRGRHA